MIKIEKRFRTIQRQLRRARIEQKVSYSRLAQRSGLSIRACHACLNRASGPIPSWLIVETISHVFRQCRPVLKGWS